MKYRRAGGSRAERKAVLRLRPSPRAITIAAGCLVARMFQARPLGDQPPFVVLAGQSRGPRRCLVAVMLPLPAAAALS